MSEWQDIATAPKDGTLLELTALDERGVEFEIWPMQWMAVQRNGLFPGAVGMWTTPDGAFTWNGSPDDCGPTHWRLPSRPMTGFFTDLTPEQKEAALAYRGPDSHGPASPAPPAPLTGGRGDE